ncbi:MAG: hypothetical protein IJG50_06745 [Clostridia bacterium]|nr:hypothetical protein [Clostridia bacterium]
MNKKLLRSILCIVLALSLVFVFAACGSQQKAEEAADQAEQEIDEALDELDAAIDEADAALDEAEAPFMDAVVTLTEDELLVDPDVVINYGDYAAMSDLASAIQNGEMDGALVAIDGDVSQFSSGMSFSITERDEEAGQSIGTTFLIQGAPESAYPADGTRVVIIGKVAIDPSGNFYCINTLPDAVQVVQ